MESQAQAKQDYIFRQLKILKESVTSQVLYLVPEIGLTPIYKAFENYFPSHE
ncbi:MAG: hypothetical protein CM15mP58_20210 [Burkholderiaceae bacterium]|nr:MAG: hypothetical protein CM15mP58_20210 [Burkholderiaceae bacterium]